MPQLNWNGREATNEPFDTDGWRLLECPELSRGNGTNLLVEGDNLPILHLILPDFEEKVKCVYIDPPYNAGNRIAHYHDTRHEDLWLSMMYERLAVLRRFLMPDGSLWISIDDRECHYLKVLCDELFGRENFVSCITVKMSYMSGVKMSHQTKKPAKLKEYLLCYARDKARLNLHPDYEPASWAQSLQRYNRYIVNIEEDYRRWQLIPVRQAASRNGINPNDEREYERFLIEHADRIIRTARNRSLVRGETPGFRKVLSKSGKEILVYENEEVLFASSKIRRVNGIPTPCNPIGDLWTDIAINNLHHEGGVDFRGGKKPEKLVRRILHMATDPGDTVLDAFLGSGTTAAVARDCGRRYIGIESEKYLETAVVRRLTADDGAGQGPSTGTLFDMTLPDITLPDTTLSDTAAKPAPNGFRFYRLRHSEDTEEVEE